MSSQGAGREQNISGSGSGSGSDLSVAQIVDAAVEVGCLPDRGDDEAPVGLALKAGQTGGQAGYILQVGSLASWKYEALVSLLTELPTQPAAPRAD